MGLIKETCALSTSTIDGLIIGATLYIHMTTGPLIFGDIRSFS